MKLSCVLTACNNNKLYMNFIPLFIKSWKKLYPNIDVKIIFISDKIPEIFKVYSDNIILYKHPNSKISTAFISQYIRILYPAILDYDGGIVITDIDMIPMNRIYFIENIKNISDDNFVVFRDNLLKKKQISICYSIATSKVWSNIFNIQTIKDINNELIKHFIESKYGINHRKKWWPTDQKQLYLYVTKWNNKTKKCIFLNDRSTNFLRLDRKRFNINDQEIQNNIKLGKYCDYHCFRPYEKFRKVNEEIYNLLV